MLCHIYCPPLLRPLDELEYFSSIVRERKE